MSENAANVSNLSRSNPIPMNHVMVSGRIANKPRRYKTKEGSMYSHIVKLPSPDSFTSPQTIEVNASRPLGEKGDDIVELCSLGGFPRTFEMKNKETGEVEDIPTANLRLVAVN